MKHQHLIHLPEGVAITEMNVSMSNALMRSAHSLKLSEKRLIAACLAKSDRTKWPTNFLNLNMDVHRASWDDWLSLEQNPFAVRISAADYAEAYGIALATAYVQLQEAADSLFERYIRIPVRSEKGVSEDKIRWVYRCKYHPGEGWAELSWSPEVVMHLYQLKREFTIYKLKQTAALQSVYSWRLFELLKGHSDPTRPYSPDIDDFARSMDVPENYSNDFAAIRRRVLDIAITELAQKYGHTITWTPRKSGRKVIGLDFNYTLTQQD